MSVPIIEGKPEIFLATVGERFPQSEPILTTFKRFSNPRTYQARVEPLGENQIYPELIAKPKDLRVGDLSISLVPNTMGPNLELLCRNERFSPTIIGRAVVGWDPYSFGSGEQKFLTMFNIEGDLNPISEEGKWLLRFMNYFSNTSKRYFKDGTPRARMLTSEEVEEIIDFSPRRFLATLQARDFADLSAISASI